MAKAEMVPVSGIHPTRGYAHAWRLGDLLFISGQVALNAQGELVGRGDVRAQAEQVFANLRTILGAVGATLRDVVKLTTLCTDPAGIPAIREVRSREFGDHAPASTLVVVAGLASPDYLLEIEAIAVIP
ncbi:MAG: RidA family protein [Armatimonadota bacterium]|nr:RidA family protein [Armatimonadota bacterium]MDR7550129.1 RidA family protein [Armatimonadota bacterium]